MNLTSYKTMGTIYRIEETQLTAKGFPKRILYLEIPTAIGMDQKTIVRKFLVLGDECGSLDFFKEGEFVEMMFKLDSFWWKPPDEDKKILLESLKVLDMHKRDNPFLTGEQVDDRPDALSPAPVVELATKVKDYVNEEGERDTLFDGPDDDGLPF